MYKSTVAVLVIVFVVSAGIAHADSPTVRPVRPVNTYSIVAFDSTTGIFGAAVQSHWFKVADVIWAEPGIGVVATQSLVDFAYGPLGLEMMKNESPARRQWLEEMYSQYSFLEKEFPGMMERYDRTRE